MVDGVDVLTLSNGGSFHKYDEQISNQIVKTLMQNVYLR